MAAKEQVQEPADFEEVLVSVTEEMEFPLDPSLLALSGNDVQQYCTMMSLMGFQNIKPEMFLKTAQGVMPLSLATVVEEYEVGPWSYDGGKSVPFDLPQQGSPGPQVRIHYDFVCHSKGDALQENPPSCLSLSKPEQGANLHSSENESVASGEKLGMFSKVHLLEQGLTGNSKAPFLQQDGFWQPNEMDFTAGQEYMGQAPEQNQPQNVSGFNQLLENGMRTAECCDDHEEASVHQRTHQGKRNHSCDDSGESVSEQLSSAVPKRSHAGETLCSCPNCGMALSLNGSPVVHGLSHPAEKLYTCPSCGYLFICETAGDAERHQETLKDDWERLFCVLDLNRHPSPKEKRFHCPDCGRGFVHKSSIPRHQKIHRKENLSQNSGPGKSCGLASSRLGGPEGQPKQKPLCSPNGGSRSPGKDEDLFAALCDVCGQSFSLVSKFWKHRAGHFEEKPFCCCHCGKAFALKSVLDRHLLLHLPERPFQCVYCDKGYIQRSHLKRHCRINHRICE